jgi:hypothetical protein
MMPLSFALKSIVFMCSFVSISCSSFSEIEHLLEMARSDPTWRDACSKFSPYWICRIQMACLSHDFFSKTTGESPKKIILDEAAAIARCQEVFDELKLVMTSQSASSTTSSSSSSSSSSPVNEVAVTLDSKLLYQSCRQLLQRTPLIDQSVSPDQITKVLLTAFSR